MLEGFRVLVPRAPHQAAGMIADLESRGAQVVAVPTIDVVEPEDVQPLVEAVADLQAGAYRWVVFTSSNAVRAVSAHRGAEENAPLWPASTSVAVVGNTTASAVRDLGLRVDVMPDAEHFNAEGLVEVFPSFDGVGSPRVLVPRADIARRVLVDGLGAKGWLPHEVVAYRTQAAPRPSEEVITQVRDGAVNAVCFTSASTVRNFVDLVGMPHDSTVIACIGPVCARQAAKLGLRVDVVPAQASAANLVDAVEKFVSKEEPHV